MAGDMNRATLIGRCGADPEVRHLQAGGRIVNLRIATSETWRDRNTGERRERTQWHTVVIWNEAIGKVAEQYLKKGAKCLVEGQIETRKWQDQQGNDRYSTEIVMRFDCKLLLLEKAKDDGGNTYDRREEGPAPTRSAPVSTGRRDDFDDPVPF